MPGFAIRRATAADASVLAHQRAGMFRDMGELPDELHDPLVKASTVYFAKAIPEGSYVAWVAENEDAPRLAPGDIGGGAGLPPRELLPRPHPQRTRLIPGPEALVRDVDTARA